MSAYLRNSMSCHSHGRYQIRVGASTLKDTKGIRLYQLYNTQTEVVEEEGTVYPVLLADAINFEHTIVSIEKQLLESTEDTFTIKQKLN